MKTRHIFANFLAVVALLIGINSFASAASLGQPENTNPLAPVPLLTGSPRLAPEAEAAMVAVGRNHTCALTGSGGVRCWGQNLSGQLGDGTTTNRLTGVEVAGLNTGAIAVVTGADHACALTGNGGVLCWGVNEFGQLGDGTTQNRLTPVEVPGMSSGVLALTAGTSHTCVLTAAGGVKCWGANYSGQLGDGTTNQRLAPVDVSGLTSGISAVAAGGSHTCALTNDGGVKCWGANYSGQLGDGTNLQRLSPVTVVDLGDPVTKVSSGGSHTCAMTNQGTLMCWGANYSGQLGDGSNNDRQMPVSVDGLAGEVTVVSAGASHTCALTSGGLQCWGRNFRGQLGNGSTEDASTPVDVSGLSEGATSVSAGDEHTCARTNRGGVKCWGANFSGQLGDSTAGYTPSPVDVVGLYSGVTGVATGGAHSCAVIGAGLQCWGENSDGQLGDGATLNRLSPVVVSNVFGASAVATGEQHTCALTAGGVVKCWGGNEQGQLGDGTVMNRLVAVDVVGLPAGMLAVATGAKHSCALTSNGGVLCWGYNNKGQLGDGTDVSRLTPVSVVDLSTGVAAIAAGNEHTCALLIAGGVKCWGENGFGQLGDGTIVDSFSPVDVNGLPAAIASVAAGEKHTCAASIGGAVLCWGFNESGQLGDGTLATHLLPTSVASLTGTAVQVSVGKAHSCARLAGGFLECWGANFYGQVGDGSTSNRLVPVESSRRSGELTAIALGAEHTCAQTSRGSLKCWGHNNRGQVGDGVPTTRLLPVGVVGFFGVGIELFLPILHR